MQDLDSPDFMAAPSGTDIKKWEAVIYGYLIIFTSRPKDSPWEGGTYLLSMDFTDNYPSKPPYVKFIRQIYHPNVYGDGEVCLDILSSGWSP